jgi:hypothetical protein
MLAAASVDWRLLWSRGDLLESTRWVSVLALEDRSSLTGISSESVSLDGLMSCYRMLIPRP